MAFCRSGRYLCVSSARRPLRPFLTQFEKSPPATKPETLYDRLDFIGGEHERWHAEIIVEHIAEPRLATDWHALSDQIGRVAIDRAERHFELTGDVIGRDRAGGTAQDLDDLE